MKNLIPSVPCYLFPDYKIWVVIALSILTIYNFFTVGIIAIYQVLAAVLTALILDGIIIKFRSKNWFFPSGAVISAMIIALLINMGDLTTTVAVVAVSIILKHIFRPSHRNIFNPAVLAIVVSSFFLPVFSAWWGAAGIITFVVGLLLVILIKRYEAALGFFVTYTVLDLARQMLQAGELNLTLNILSGPIVFFAFIMVIEPVTTPKTALKKWIFGIVVALISFGLSFDSYLMGNSFFLYLSLLAMNLVMRFLPDKILE